MALMNFQLQVLYFISMLDVIETDLAVNQPVKRHETRPVIQPNRQCRDLVGVVASKITCARWHQVILTLHIVYQLNHLIVRSSQV